MSIEEKGALTEGIVVVVMAVVYLILFAASGAASTGTGFTAPMLIAIGVSIAVSIVAFVIVTIASGAVEERADLRDRQIYRFGEYVGRWPLIAGALGALVLCMIDADVFWIANTIYAGFALSAILASVVKLVAYRRGLPAW